MPNVLVRGIAVLKYGTMNNWDKEALFRLTTRRSHSITEGSLDRNSNRAGTCLIQRSQMVLLTGLLCQRTQDHLLRGSTTHSELLPPTSITRKYMTGLPTGQSQEHFPSSKMILGHLAWYQGAIKLTSKLDLQNQLPDVLLSLQSNEIVFQELMILSEILWQFLTACFSQIKS